MHSVTATPRELISRPVTNNCKIRVMALTNRSILAKNAVLAARSGKYSCAMFACWKYRNVEVSEYSRMNSARPAR
ncbi:hypothetical protein D3C72_2494380 [compost metagenome]